MTDHVLRITAENIANSMHAQQLTHTTRALLNLAGSLKSQRHRALLVLVSYPDDGLGGVELRVCKGRFARLCVQMFGKRVSLWDS